MNSKKMHGEGNKEAAKVYNEKTREFVEEGRVKDAMDRAEPETTAEKVDIEQAEKAGANRAAETEPKNSNSSQG